ncbi:hypothetical protein Prudu_1332S000200, partial [Prunus dulcis]
MNPPRFNFSQISDGENFAVRPPFEAPFLAKLYLFLLPAHPFSPIENPANGGGDDVKTAETADVAGDVSGHLELRRHLEQGGLCQNFGKESRFLVSGPGIGVMSEQRRGPLRSTGKFRGGSCH